MPREFESELDRRGILEVQLNESTEIVTGFKALRPVLSGVQYVQMAPDELVRNGEQVIVPQNIPTVVGYELQSRLNWKLETTAKCDADALKRHLNSPIAMSRAHGDLTGCGLYYLCY